MKQITIDNSAYGLVLAKEIYNFEGKILLEKGTVLNKNYIEKLSRFGITHVFVDDELFVLSIENSILAKATKDEVLRIVTKAMVMSSDALNEELAIINKKIAKIIDELLLREDVFINLNDIKILDDYTFEHSVNVFVYSSIIGISLGYSFEELKILGIGSLLHDIGKLSIPDSILKKPTRLEDHEFECIKNHAVLGYEILSKCSNITEDSALVALMHHERLDGTGYPSGIYGRSISEFAKITAVTDVFDALTSDRVYRNKLKPKEVVDFMKSKGYSYFDKKIFESFLKFVAIYPVGSGVVLNTGEKAKVLNFNKSDPSKPMIRVLYDKLGKSLVKYYDVNLENEAGLFVAESCDI